MARIDLYERASRLFKRLERSRILRDQIKEWDQAIQFDPHDGEPFYVQVKQGRVDLGKGKKYTPDFAGCLYINGDRDSLDSLIRGKISLAESIYHHKIRIPGYRTKEPVMAWFSTLIRKGLGKD